MSSSVTRRRQPSRTPRPSQGSGWRRPIIWSVLIVTTVWSIAAAAYFALRKDDTQPIAEMQAGYEKRIADLRTEFDRATNHQLLDQKQIQQKLDALLQRQAALERHTPTTADDQLATGSTIAKEPEASSIANEPPVAKPDRAPGVTKPAGVRHRHRLGAQRLPAAKPQQHAGQQSAPAPAQVNSGAPTYAPE
jgi:hypothetical protein